VIAVDPDARQIKLDLPDPCDQFHLIIKLFNGESIKIDESNIFFLCAAATSLGISLLLNKCRELTKVQNVVIIAIEENDRFNGVVRYMREILQRLPKITASSTVSDKFPENLIDKDFRATFWESLDQPNQSVQFDFEPLRIKLRSYIVKSADNSSDLRHVKSWIMVGSNDEEDWKTLDQRDGVLDICGKNDIGVFHCNEEGIEEEAFRYLRMVMTEPNQRGDWVFRISKIEFFGEVHETECPSVEEPGM
jgi:hypothetical protein